METRPREEWRADCAACPPQVRKAVPGRPHGPPPSVVRANGDCPEITPDRLGLSRRRASPQPVRMPDRRYLLQAGKHPCNAGFRPIAGEHTTLGGVLADRRSVVVTRQFSTLQDYSGSGGSCSGEWKGTMSPLGCRGRESNPHGVARVGNSCHGYADRPKVTVAVVSAKRSNRPRRR